MKPLKIPTSPKLLLDLAYALVELEGIEYSSVRQREMFMEMRVSLGARIFRARLKDPIQKNLRINSIEANVLHYAVERSERLGIEDQRKALFIINPLII